MNLEYYSKEKLRKEVLEIVGKYLDLRKYRIFFFGSRVRGDNFPGSDIDIGIDGSEPIPPAIKLEIEEQLDNLPTLYKFDLIDFNTVSVEFKKEVYKNVEFLN